MNISKKNDKIIKGILILAAIITVIGMTYALLNITLTGTKNYIVGTNGLKVYLDESKTLTDVVGQYVVPVPDYKGLQNDSYEFSIVNDEITGMDYSIYLVLNEENNMPSYGMRYNLVNDKLDLNKIGNIDDEKDDTGKLLYSGSIYAKSSHDFKLKLWLGIDAGNDCKEKTFSAKIMVTAVQNIINTYADESGANRPQLSNGMIPVTYNGENWVKVDTSRKWYDYNEQWWANAVTVGEENRQTYMDAEAGTPINMDDINTMWVWIPRYEYETITATEATEIKVNFLNGTESNKTNNYITHPAFTFGDDELTGIWVAKFEASSDKECTPTASDVNNGCDITSLKVNVKPNVSSWRGIRISTADLNARAMNDTGNIYGFIESQVDTHVMKNLEWGSVAYLSQSKYGRCIDGTCTEVTINSNSSYLTGYSSVAYSNNNGMLASTTGNIYGIYDMAGGAWEYVMGVIKDNTTDNPMSGSSDEYNSGFTGKLYNSGSYKDLIGRNWPSAKYFDLYEFGTTYNDAEAYARSKTGDATTETKGWYNDYADFIITGSSWFARGGGYDGSTNTGIFGFFGVSGGSAINGSFRPVLVQK